MPEGCRRLLPWPGGAFQRYGEWFLMHSTAEAAWHAGRRFRAESIKCNAFPKRDREGIGRRRSGRVDPAAPGSGLPRIARSGDQDRALTPDDHWRDAFGVARRGCAPAQGRYGTGRGLNRDPAAVHGTARALRGTGFSPSFTDLHECRACFGARSQDARNRADSAARGYRNPASAIARDRASEPEILAQIEPSHVRCGNDRVGRSLHQHRA